MSGGIRLTIAVGNATLTVMQKAIRFNENQLLYLASKARQENTIAGLLYKKSSDTGKWQLRYFVLYQNLLFYFENENTNRPSGVACLEGSYCDRVVTPAALKAPKDPDKQVSSCFYLLCCKFVVLFKNNGK
ncbi:hypothetical protein KUTeg_017525 [Tegillarca granosa]|uniref:PH domain-containing protein n=1 Tax=Tegillarca granosa TaxID=220873 RepID=A0ABQ9EK29_TEGGR|nr:hypothetical protein KUTeg_017525 [Tegillarca granosa]